jgi:hypothetical protein
MSVGPSVTRLFQKGEAYWRSAVALQSAGIQNDHADVPIRNLYSHAIEMYLKSYLNFHGHSVDELDGKFRQNFRRIRRRVESFGLRFAGRDKATMEYFVHTPAAVRLEYSGTAYYSAPTLEDLYDLCLRLREFIGTEVGLGSGCLGECQDDA